MRVAPALRTMHRMVYPLDVPIGKWLCVLLPLMTRTMIAQELPPDVVALTGKQLPTLLGVPPSKITAVSAHHSTLAPAYAQVDQRYRADDGSLRYAFEAGDDPRVPRSTGLGDDDLLLLSVSDAGEQLPSPPPNYAEVEITDPVEGSRRWVYLGPGWAPPLAPHLHYDAAAKRISGLDYAIGFSGDGTAVIDTLVLGDPLHGPNILDRSKARLDVDLALGIGSVARTEGDTGRRGRRWCVPETSPPTVRAR